MKYPREIPEEGLDVSIETEKFKAWMQTKLSPKIDPVELARLVLTAWNPEDAVIMVAIAGAESGFKVRALNVNTKGARDYGIYQINDIHKPTELQKYDPVENVRMAYNIWKRQGFGAWYAYRAGKHTAFLPLATDAVNKALGV